MLSEQDLDRIEQNNKECRVTPWVDIAALIAQAREAAKYERDHRLMNVIRERKALLISFSYTGDKCVADGRQSAYGRDTESALIEFAEKYGMTGESCP